MYEIYISDALAPMNLFHEGERVDDERVKIRQQAFIFNKYGVTKVEYDSALLWYGKNLDKYLDITKNIEKKLTDRKDILAQKTKSDSIESITQTDTMDFNTANLLRLKNYYTSYDLAINHNIQFRIESPSTVSPGDTLLFSLNMRSFPEEMKKSRPRISLTVHYENDSIDNQVMRIDSAGIFRKEIMTDPDNLIRYLDGNIRFNREAVRKNFIVVDNISLTPYSLADQE